MVSRNHNQEQYAEFAYFDKETAMDAVKKWNEAQLEKDMADAKENGREYDDWIGPYNDYAYFQQVEII